MCNGVTEMKKNVDNLKIAQLSPKDSKAQSKLIDFHSTLRDTLFRSYQASIKLVGEIGDSPVKEIASAMGETLTNSLTVLLDKAGKSSRVIKFITGDLNKLGAEIIIAREKAKSFKAI